MEFNEIISWSHHCLHLCNHLNQEEIVFSSVMDTDVFVTINTQFWEEKFKDRHLDCRIKKPGVVKPDERIVVDATSLGQDFRFWEEKWKKQAQIICIYTIDTIDRASLKDLVALHDKMILSVDKLRMLSDKNLEQELNRLSPEMVENLVKRELKNILVSFLLTRPMCGTDLVKLLYQKFKVFISPGQLYPALHGLEKEGLLTYELKLKNKVYHVKEKEKAELLLKNHAKANSLVLGLLQTM